MKKKILYIHQYFITPKQAGGTRSYWFAKELLKNGYDVTMLTSDTSEKSSSKIYKQNIDGIKVIYINIPYKNEMGIFKRASAFFRFMIKACIYAFREKNIDLVFATSTPLTIGLPALLLKWFKGKKFIFEVRDLWPEVPIQMGAINNRLIKKLLYSFEKLIYKNATHIVALSPGMVEGVLKYGINENKVTMIPNMAKIDKFNSHPPNLDIAKKFNLNPDKFNIIHFGAMGIANGLDYIISCAEILNSQNISDVEFILLGDGKTKVPLQEKVNKLNLSNIIFIPAQEMKIVSEIVNLSSCSIVTFTNIPILRTNSPNKLFDSLSAGKPIIVNSSGWTKEMVEKNNCGSYVDPEDPNSLANLIKYWKNNKQIILQYGQNARKLAENKYDKSILSNKFYHLIDITNK